ncbi:Peroxidase [Quillaja saponaria]|uniref:Peroxidase n=1 Tax=Quillaja saponaria TaxID=32244 RepID=A0AAD7PZC5_QUISA|nr:Peroxidase [Quillaja saponaria]
MKSNNMSLILLSLFFFVIPFAFARLQVGFYSTSCPQVESIVRQVVKQRFGRDKSITAALLRMHFHDCFVKGCDASILIDSTSEKESEKTAGPNLTVRGYEFIDEIKKRLETACPSTVSCADIITLATRDAVALSGGPNYNVPTGRLDGLISDPSKVNLPGPSSSVSEAVQIFNSKGMTLNDMVTLLGAHTVGVAHCNFFEDRLSSSNGGKTDPTMDPSLDAKLVKLCGSSSNPNPSTFLDQGTGNVFDNQFFNQILSKKGVLQIDQELAVDRSSVRIVSNFARNGAAFQKSFADAMIKLGNLQDGSDGEIRKNCRVFN